MKTKIAIFGSAEVPRERTIFGFAPKKRRLARDLGEALGRICGDKITILTGACVGIPDLVANHARKYGTTVIGYSGMKTLREHLVNPNYVNPDRLDRLRFINSDDIVLNGLTERSLQMIRDADALVYSGGRTGTLLEYCAAFDGSDKPMYVLHGLGGAMDRMSRLKIGKQRKAGSIFEIENAIDLVERLCYDFKIPDTNNRRDQVGRDYVSYGELRWSALPSIGQVELR